MLDEFYRIAFRKKLYETIEDLQADLDLWMREFNQARPHQGKWCFGKTPMQTFLDALPLARKIPPGRRGKPTNFLFEETQAPTSEPLRSWRASQSDQFRPIVLSLALSTMFNSTDAEKNILKPHRNQQWVIPPEANAPIVLSCAWTKPYRPEALVPSVLDLAGLRNYISSPKT
jgi:hypothetical protein